MFIDYSSGFREVNCDETLPCQDAAIVLLEGFLRYEFAMLVRSCIRNWRFAR